MKKLGTLLVVFSFAALGFLPGCAQKRKAKGTIGVSVMTLANPFFKVIGDTITEEAAKLGFDTIVVSGESDVSRQANQVDDFIVKGVDAIVLCPCDSKGIGEAIRKANREGIPVFTADLAYQKGPGDEASVVSHIATDNLEGGRQAAHGMIEALGPAGGKIIILDYKTAESCILRVQGFREVLEKNKKNRITIEAELPGDGREEKGYKSTEDALQTYPDLAGIFAINDPCALGARAALERAGKADQVKIIGFDGQPEGKQAIKEGKIYADPIQFPDQIAIKTVQAIRDYFDGKEVPAEQFIKTELYKKEKALKDPTLK